MVWSLINRPLVWVAKKVSIPKAIGYYRKGASENSEVRIAKNSYDVQVLATLEQDTHVVF